jgi:hypothetical protein
MATQTGSMAVIRRPAGPGETLAHFSEFAMNQLGTVNFTGG